MNTTKAYVVMSYSVLSMGHSSPSLVFFSKLDAEFYVWKENQTTINRQSFTVPYYGHKLYSVKEVTVAVGEKNEKQFKKFLDAKLRDMDRDIEKKRACADLDEQSIKTLEAEKAEYEKLL